MTEFANKYEQEAHHLVEGLAGTKWGESGSVPLIPARSRTPLQSLEDYTRANPFRALIITASVAFIYGSLRAVVRR